MQYLMLSDVLHRCQLVCRDSTGRMHRTHIVHAIHDMAAKICSSSSAAAVTMLQVASGGVVRDGRVHTEVIEAVCTGIAALGFTSEGHIESPIKGASSGNKEFLALFRKL